jgi:hypothetical protein
MATDISSDWKLWTITSISITSKYPRSGSASSTSNQDATHDSNVTSILTDEGSDTLPSVVILSLVVGTAASHLLVPVVNVTYELVNARFTTNHPYFVPLRESLREPVRKRVRKRVAIAWISRDASAKLPKPPVKQLGYNKPAGARRPPRFRVSFF